MSSKKSVLRLMPEGVELLILAINTSPLNGRKTTMRNSTTGVSKGQAAIMQSERTIDVDQSGAVAYQAF